MKNTAAIFLFAGFSLTLNAQLPEFEWANYATGSGGPATYAYSSCYDHSGNSFVLGAFNGTVDIDPSANVVSLNGYVGMFVAKYDPAGQMLWGKQVGITTMQIQSSVSPRRVACDDSGNVYITGALVDVYADFDVADTTNPIDTTSGGYDLFFAKYTSAGTLSWSMLLGSTAHEEGWSMCFLGDKIFLAGQYGCFTDFDPGPGTHIPPISQFCVSGFLACYTTNGDFVWQNSYCGPSLSSAGYGIPNIVRLNSDNELVICGRMGGVVDYNPGAGLDTLSVQPSGGVDAFFAKFDTAGNFIFAKGLVTITDYVYPTMTVDTEDNIIVAGSFSGIMDFDPSAGVYRDTALDYAVANGTDVFIAKYDPNGNFLWEQSFGTNNNTEDLTSVATDSANHILIGGQFYDAVDVDCGPGVYLLNDVNNINALTDGLVVKYDENGNFIFGFVVSGSAYDNVSSVSCYEDKFLTTGNFSQGWDFNPGAGVNTVPATVTNGHNYFHVQYFDTALVASVVNHSPENSAIGVYPVPATSIVNFSFSTFTNADVNIVLYSLEGKTVLTQNSQLVNNVVSVDVSSLAAGTYLAEISQGGVRETKRVVIAH